MRVETKQTTGFADYFVDIPETELDTLNEIIDWGAISNLLTGIKTDYAPESMFKMMLLQTWHNMSDEMITQAMKRDMVFIRFCGFTLEGNKPDASTLCRFRQKLIERKRLPVLLEKVNRGLQTQGLKVAEGKYVTADATLVGSARCPRLAIESQEKEEGENETRQEVRYSDDKEATWVKKRGKAVYGYAGTFTTDEDGLVETVLARPANESEMTNFVEVLDEAGIGKGRKVLYDKGVDSKANRKALKERGLKDGIMRKKPKGKKMKPWEKARNRLISKRRFAVERTFGTLKMVYGMARARYVGLEKVKGEMVMKSIAYNMKRALNLHRKLQVKCA